MKSYPYCSQPSFSKSRATSTRHIAVGSSGVETGTISLQRRRTVCGNGASSPIGVASYSSSLSTFGCFVFIFRDRSISRATRRLYTASSEQPRQTGNVQFCTISRAWVMQFAESCCVSGFVYFPNCSLCGTIVRDGGLGANG